MIFPLAASQNRPLLDFIVTSYWEYGEYGATNVSLFCSNSSYDKHDLSSSESVDDVYSDEDSEDGNSEPLGMEPYQYKLVVLSTSAVTESSSDEDKDEADWRLGRLETG